MKIKSPIIFTAALTALTFMSCKDQNDKALDIDRMVDCIPVVTEPGGRWGMISTDGEIMFTKEFAEEPTLAVNNVFSVNEGDGISIYTIGMQPQLIDKCEHLVEAGIFNDGLIPIVRPNSRIEVIDVNGVTQFTLMPINKSEITACANIYSDGLLIIVNQENLYGCINATGEVVITPKYSSLGNFSSGYAIGRTMTSGMPPRDIIINTIGETVCEARAGYVIVSPYVVDNEVVISDTAGNISIMNLKGEEDKLPTKVKTVGEYNNTILTFATADGLWGIMSRKADHKVLLRPKFKSLSLVNGGEYFLANLDDKWSIIDIEGRQKIDIYDAYRSVIPVRYGGKIKYMAMDNAGWLMLDEKGQQIHTQYDVYDYGVSPTLEPGLIKSAFYSLDKFENQILSLINLNSIGGIQLHTIANVWYEDQSPEQLDENDENVFIPTKQPMSGNGYSIKLLGVTDRQITVEKYNRKTGAYEAAIVPYNTVNAVEMAITTTWSDIYDKTKDTLVKALIEKGYRLVDETDEAVTLASPYANLEISREETSDKLTILMYTL